MPEHGPDRRRRLAPLFESHDALRAGEIVGRGAEIDDLTARLEQGAALVTIVGPAGVGKSTLARHALAALEASPPETGLRFASPSLSGTPIGWVGVAAARDARGVALAVAGALGLSPPAAGDDAALVALVARALGGHGPAVLVLDNLEQVVAAAAATVGAWLAACPDLQIVATSRERLGVAEESVLALRPLSTPQGDDVDDGDAVKLWVASVRKQRPSYRVEPDEAPVVARLLRELDGLPLAIELAAARAPVLGARGLLDRLPARLDLLQAPSHDGTGPSLRRALEASYELLDPDEKVVFARSSVFAGAFGLDAAEAVLADDDEARPAGSRVASIIQSLHDKSLLRAHPGAPGEVLLSHYQCTRAFAAAKLGPEGRDGVVARHTAHFAARVGAVVGLPRRAARREWLRLRLERDDIEAMLQRALLGADPEPAALGAALRAAAELAMARCFDTPIDLELERFSRAFAAPRIGEVDLATQAAALAAWARCAMRAGRLDMCRERVDAALTLARGLRLTAVEALGTEVLSRLATLEGRAADADEHARAAIELARSAVDARVTPFVVWSVAATFRQEGRPDEARRLLERLLGSSRVDGESPYESWILAHLGLTSLELGDLASAAAYAERAVQLCRETDDGDGLWNALMAAGGAGLEGARAADAVAWFDEARDVARSLGDARLAAFAAGYGGLARCERGDGAAAALEVVEAAAELEHAGRRGFAGSLRALLGAHAANAGDVERARALFDDATAALGAQQASPLFGAAALARACLSIAEARRAGDGAALEEARRGARDALEAARVAVPAGGRAPLLARSTEARLAARQVERALGAAPIATPTPLGDPPLLAVHAEGTWFRFAGGERIACSRRPVLRRMLCALATARVERPGVPVTAAALLAAGWPAEKMLPGAARNRLYVAICRLRDLGLRDALIVADRGYLVSERQPVELVE